MENWSIGGNPYSVGGPVREARMFFGREEEVAFLRRELLRGPDGGAALAVLWGGRRTGKSSILMQVAAGKLGADALPVLIDLEQAPSPRGLAGLWRMFGQRSLARLREEGLPTAAAEEELPTDRERTPNERFRRFLSAVAGTLGPRRVVFLIDEYEMLERWVHAGHVGADAVDGLGGILDANIPVSFVFVGGYRLDQRDPEVWGRLTARALHRRVAFLSPAEAERLVREPLAGKVEYDDGVVPAILRASAGHPFLVQAIGWAVVERLRDEGRSRCTTEDLEAALGEADDEEAALPLFVSWWRALGFLGRVAASTLAAELEDADGYVAVEQAEALLAGEAAPGDGGKVPLEVDRAALRAALDALVAAEDLERDAAGGYRFRADILRRWLIEAHPPWDVVRCAAEEPEAAPRRGLRQRLRQRPRLWFWVVVAAIAIVLLAVRSFFPAPGERPPGPGAPAAGGGAVHARAWRLGPDLVPVPARVEDPATIRAEAGRLVAFRSTADGGRLDVTISWPTGVPGPAAGWLDALERPEESWLWGVFPELAPDPGWLSGADERFASNPVAGSLPPWFAVLLAPAARLSVEYDDGHPARVAVADRTGWRRAEWCVGPGRWERCTDDGSLLQRVAFAFEPPVPGGTPLLARVRFLGSDDRPAPDALGRSEIAFLYRDVDPSPRDEQWEIETVVTTFLRGRPTSAGTPSFAPPPGWQGLGTGGVALTGSRGFHFYFREDRALGRRGGEVAAIQARDHVGRAATLDLAWGPGVQTVFFARRGGSRTAFFVGTDANPVADAAGAYGYREDRTAEGVRTRLTLLGADGACAAEDRTEWGVRVNWCAAVLAGVPDASLAPPADGPARLLGPYAIEYRDAGGAAASLEGVARASLRDLGPAPAPCERLVAVQHHDPAGGLVAPTRGPFAGSAATRLAVRLSDGRLADLVRTDCADGPCAEPDVLDETWSCNERGCVLSNVPLSCREE